MISGYTPIILNNDKTSLKLNDSNVDINQECPHMRRGLNQPGKTITEIKGKLVIIVH